jgi:hypothetical protein
MFFRTRRDGLVERDYEQLSDSDIDLKHLSHINLTQNDMEFIKLKRSKKSSKYYAPDPRLGDYET